MSSSRSRSKNKRSQKQNVLKMDEVDEIMENITLKKPRSGYTHFCIEEIEKFKNKNKSKKIELKTFSGECAAKWGKLSDKERAKYHDKFEEEKIKYKQDLDLVRHHLFMDYNDIVHRAPTAYRLFLNERLRKGFEKNEDPKDVKKKASDDWRKMDIEDKEKYLDQKKENDTWFEKARKTKKVTPLTMFVQKALEAAREKGQEAPKLADLADTWKRLKSSDKDTYKKYADELNSDRERTQHLYELVHGIKPKRPARAFRVFLQEKAKEKELHSLKQGKEMWDKLSENEKETYLKKAHTIRLAYKYKKMIYNKKIRKILPKKPATAFGQFLKEKKGLRIPKGEKPIVYWRPIYDQLPKDKKKKYEEKAKLAKEKYEKKMAEYSNYVFDMPKRPVTAFALYVRDRIPDLREKDKKSPVTKLIKKAAEEWTSGEGISHSKYESKARQDKKRFKKQLKDFETLGYYKKNYRAERTTKDEDESEDEEEEKKTKRKKRSSSSKKSTKRTRSKSRTKPRSKTKSKTQAEKRRSKSKKPKKK